VWQLRISIIIITIDAEDSGLSTGATAAITVIAVVAVLLLIVILIILYIRQTARPRYSYTILSYNTKHWQEKILAGCGQFAKVFIYQIL